MFAKQKNLKSPQASELQDFGLFKKPKKEIKPEAGANPSKVKPAEVIDVDVVDVDDIKNKKTSDSPVESDGFEESRETSSSVENEPDVELESNKAAEPTTTARPASPFGKSSGAKPGLSIKRDSAKQDTVKLKPEKKGLFSIFGGTKSKDNSSSSKQKPASFKESVLAGAGKENESAAKDTKKPTKNTSSVSATPKPFNALSFVLVACLAGTAYYGFDLKSKLIDLQRKENQDSVQLQEATASFKAASGQIAKQIDDKAMLNLVPVVTRAKLLELPDSTLEFEATAAQATYSLVYKLKDNVDAYDFSKFNESEFPSFSTGEFKSCATNNGAVKQGDKDAFAISIKC